MKCVVIDYGMGNLRSVSKACEKVGFEALVSSDPEQVDSAQALILPGVGAFGECVANLEKRNLFSLLQKILKKQDRPFLGICLGLQLLFSESEESGSSVRGLGVIEGKVKKFNTRLKVPHMGWNQVEIQKESPLFDGIPDKSFFYFVHSYYVEPAKRDVSLTETEYGEPFVSSIHQGKLYATQFHPEKSQELGLKVLENFKKVCGS